MDARCRIELFGALRVTQGDLVHTRFRSHKAAALLGYLALYLNQAHSREHLLELFWPDREIEVGRNNLSTTLSQLRRQLEPTGIPAKSVLVADHQQVRLNEESVSTDVAEFDQLIKRGKRVEEPQARILLLLRVMELYRGPLLPGNYEDWAVREQSRCRTDYLEALALLADTLEESGDPAGALATAQRMAEADPYEEDAYRTQMRLHLRLDRPVEALEVFRSLERLYRKEMGALPSPETRALAEQIRKDPRATLAVRGSGSRLSTRSAAPVARAPVAAPAEAAPSSDVLPPAPPLPLQLTRFFGRQQEREDLYQRFLAPQTRLVTLLGTGGVGKTRLSVAVAEQLLPAFAGRVWSVPLADVPDPALIPYALLSALRLPPAVGADPLERVVEALGTAPCLLVLDNFEHLLREAPEPGKSDQMFSGNGPALVRMLLARVPGLVILVTSRQALRLAGEQEFPLSPLAVPLSSTASPESLLANESIALYTDRARSVKPDFNLTANNADAVAKLCRMLEGVPLAIEMAAAWARTLPPQGLLERLNQQLNLLVSRQRDLPLRHRSLRATIEWSYNLLPPELRDLFACLGTFRGGWTLEAAEAICGAEALENLSELQERSLVLMEEREGEMRYRLLEPLREFALEQLQATNRWEEARRAHADYFLAFSEQASNHFTDADQALWLDRLERDHDNLRHALAWYEEETTEGEPGLRLVGALWWFWQMRGHYGEGSKHLVTALRREGAGTKIRATALYGAGSLAHHQGDYVRARVLYEESLALHRELGDRRGVSDATHALAILAVDEEDYALAQSLYKKVLTICRELGESLRIGNALHNLGHIALIQGEDARAQALMEEALTIFQSLGAKHGIAHTLRQLGNLALRQGDLAGAVQSHRVALAIWLELGEKQAIAYNLENMASWAQAADNGQGAARLWGAAARLRKSINTPLPPGEQRLFDQEVAQANAGLGADLFTAAWEEGKALDWKQAAEHALEMARAHAVPVAALTGDHADHAYGAA